MGAIHLSEVRCSGQEPSLWKCPSKNITAEDCSHSQDAAVRCNLPYTGVETKVSHALHLGSFYTGPASEHSLPASSPHSPQLPQTLPFASPFSVSAPCCSLLPPKLLLYLYRFD